MGRFGSGKSFFFNLVRNLAFQKKLVVAQADFSIAIRTAWTSPSDLLFGVGGGVVWDSDPLAEYQETVHKGSSIVRCLNS